MSAASPSCSFDAPSPVMPFAFDRISAGVKGAGVGVGAGDASVKALAVVEGGGGVNDCGLSRTAKKSATLPTTTRPKTANRATTPAVKNLVARVLPQRAQN